MINELIVVTIIKVYIFLLLSNDILKTFFIFLISISFSKIAGVPFLIVFIQQFFSIPDIVNNSILFSSSTLLLIKVKLLIGANDS